MAILGPNQLPVVLKVDSDPIKFEVLSQLGHPVILVEMTEPQLEQAIRVTGDFIATYFPHEEKYAYFYTQPLVTEYPLPPDAYWIKDVKWDPATTRICLDINSMILLPDLREIRAQDVHPGDFVLSYSINSNKLVKSTVLVRKNSGRQICKCVTTTSGHNVIASLNHKFLTNDGWKLLRDLVVGDYLFCIVGTDIINSSISNIDEAGEIETVDFQVENENLIANRIVVHNSDIFGAESFLFNVGNVTGIQNILLDYHLLQAYRKFSQRILATEGQWEVKGDNKIRLFPTPRGSYPVVVEYFPVVSRFRTPWAKEITKRAMVAEAKIMIGNARSKFGGIPSPDGGTINLNGDAMRTEGQQEKAQAVQDAILHGEPLGVFLWSLLFCVLLPSICQVMSSIC